MSKSIRTADDLSIEFRKTLINGILTAAETHDLSIPQAARGLAVVAAQNAEIDGLPVESALTFVRVMAELAAELERQFIALTGQPSRI